MWSIFITEYFLLLNQEPMSTFVTQMLCITWVWHVNYAVLGNLHSLKQMNLVGVCFAYNYTFVTKYC
jgi:hypothetical protein